MDSLASNLKRLLEYRSKSERLEMFDGQGRLVVIVIQFIMKTCSKDDNVIVSLQSLEESAKFCWDNPKNRDFSNLFWSFMKEIEGFFQVPNTESPWNHNELVALSIDLFLEILEEILRLQPNFILRVKDSIQALYLELTFLITFLGDTPSQPTELYTSTNVLADIEEVANDVGRFLYSFFFIRDRILVSAMSDHLSHLLGNLKLVKEKIIEHCNTISKTSSSLSHWTQGTDVVSLFLVDSVLDDVKDLKNHKDGDRIDSAVKDQIEKIHCQLLFLRSMLGVMEVEQYPQLAEFLSHIRDMAYEVEYVVRSFSPAKYLNIRLGQVLEKTELVKMQLEELKNKYEAGMLEDVGLSRQIISQAETPQVGDDIGLEGEASIIIEHLLGNTEKLQIISISGMPGLGKTTLAKKIYNDPKIVQTFDKRAWCVVSQNYRLRNMLVDLLMSMNVLNKDAMMGMDEDSLGHHLSKSLMTSSRFIVVMDDIWNIDAWHEIKTYIPHNEKENRILFTTRNEDLVSKASSFPIVPIVHPLKHLKPDECWELLERRVFNKKSCPSNLIGIGNKIAEKCNGLPLAVVVIAPVLANLKKEPNLWEDVAERIRPHLAKGMAEQGNILEISYDYLPMHLKPCFLYLGAFEEDREISVRKLTSLWVAEGFVQRVDDKSVEEEAQKYLTQLTNRSLVQVSKRRSDGGVKTCSIHDLLRDMCLQIGERDTFMKVIQDPLPNQDAKSWLVSLSSTQKQYQRLGIHSRSVPPFSRASGLHVRSLLGHLPDPSIFKVGNSKLLKVFDLSSMDLKFHDSTQIEDLVLLRFLAVSSVPSSIEIFQNLEILFVDNRKMVEITEKLFDMVKLRRVYFSGGAKFSKSLRDRAAKGDGFPTSSLHTVSYLSIYDENDEKILRNSPGLQRLKCRFAVFWDSSEEIYRYPALNFLKQLVSLSISFRRSYVIDDPSPDLTSLPSTLKKLTLRNFNLSGEQMDTIQKLTQLEVLKLRDGTIEDDIWDTRGGEFEKLIFLELDAVEIEEWSASPGDFPLLERLVLRSCRFKIPSDTGYCAKLVKIEVHGCDKAVEDSALAIQEEQIDYSNDIQVIISHS